MIYRPEDVANKQITKPEFILYNISIILFREF